MIPSKPILKINKWGLSHHGLITNGVLALSNGSTMAYPNPITPNCLLVKYDSTPAVQLSVDDTVKGRNYKDYALVSGGTLAGVNVDGQMLYKDPLKQVWLIKITKLSVSGTVFTLKADFSRFGYIPLKPKPLQTGSVTFSVETNMLFTGIGNSFSVENIHPNNDKCICMFKLGNSYCFIELKLSGVIRPDTLVGLVVTSTMKKTYPETVAWTAVEGAVLSTMPASLNRGLAVATGFGVPKPTASGQTTGKTTITATPSFDPPAQYDTRSEYVLNKIHTAFYSSDGALKFVSLRVTSIDSEVTELAAGCYVGDSYSQIVDSWHSAMGSGWLWSEDGDVQRVNSEAVFGFIQDKTKETTISLLVDGAVRSTLRSSNSTLGISRVDKYIIGISPLYRPNTTPDGTSVGSNLSSTIILNTSGTIDKESFDSVIDADSKTYQGQIHARIKTAYAGYQSSGGIPDANTGLILKGTDYQMEVVNLNNNMTSIRYGFELTDDRTGSGLPDIAVYQAATPDNSDTAVVYMDRRAPKKNAYNPATGEIIRGSTDLVNFI